MMLSVLLEEQGYHVVTASDGSDALERLGFVDPQIIITDYMMPKLTGVQLISAIRKMPGKGGIPILLMSAALPPEIELSKVDVPFLYKPANIAYLLRLIDDLITGNHRIGSQQLRNG